MTGPDISELAAEEIAALKRAWWVLLVSGILSVGFGVLLLVWPGRTVTVVAGVFGLLMVVSGVFRFITALLAEGLESRWLYVLSAVLGVVLGVVVMKYPEQTIAVIVLIAAVFWLISGMVELFSGIAHDAPDRGIRVVFGAVSIAFGAAVLLWPAPTLLVFAVIAGVYAILIGILEIIAAFALKNA